jgi:hypothetical protein
MKLLFLCGVAAAAIASCTDSTEGPDFKTSYTATFQRNGFIKADTIHRKIAPDSSGVLYKLSISPGNNYVFRHRKSTVPTNKDIQDGISDQTLIFQVPNDAKKFNYSGRELAAAHVFYRVATIGPSRVFKVKSGVLQGKKTASGRWKIHADVTISAFHDTTTVEFDKTFHYKKYPYENR